MVDTRRPRSWGLEQLYRRPYCVRHFSVNWNLMTGKKPLFVASAASHRRSLSPRRSGRSRTQRPSARFLGHGPVGDQTTVSEMTSLTSMATCISCHQARHVNTTCAACHAWPQPANIAITNRRVDLPFHDKGLAPAFP